MLVKKGRGKPGLPKSLDHDSMKRLLEREGWAAEVGGKHVTKMTKDGERPITLPRHQGGQYGARLRAAILRQAKLTGPDETDLGNASGE